MPFHVPPFVIVYVASNTHTVHHLRFMFYMHATTHNMHYVHKRKHEKHKGNDNSDGREKEREREKECVCERERERERSEEARETIDFLAYMEWICITRNISFSFLKNLYLKQFK